MLTGLFLGAGASYEVGMPLVWDLTAELKAWLTPEKLRELNRGWRSDGGGHPDDVIEVLAPVLALPDLHYESILGFLETQFRRNSTASQDFHGLYAWLVEMVYWILHSRHINNVGLIQRSLRYLDGIVRLAEKNSPLWIFSLNHDLIIECLAADHNLPLNCGFTASVVTLPRRDATGVKTGELRAEVITGEQLEKSGMPFFQPGNFGINLLKIHGALDTFTFRDGKDLLRVLPAERGSAGVIETLRAVNEEVKYVDAANPARPVKMANGIVYADEDGEMQFLNRSLLAGAFKFDNRMSQVLPIRLLDYFRSNINYVQKLICIGYGFGDIHINQVLRGWLEFSGDRQLEIVAPGLKAIPPPLLHLAPQVRIVDSAATDFLDASGGIVRTRREALEKRLVRWARSRGGGGKKEFEAFLQKFHESHVQAFVEKLKALPRRDGDIDLEALGLDRDEFVRRWASELGINVEDLLEAFMKSLEG